ncbi:hypothetical protein H6G80_06255 [Nostoc sp. FACHB-87]|uniref:hypothetical protein n=1 Tax=Nostocaceae TaxID=1162 RepID=UPI001686056C|nr:MULTISPECIES: hypothetical protein [Nostocaceae]MBD2453677.1 hypothetical protein [Nostoc sp. FACHB-87]MBD2475368.1 hypothetical protein [Anabaena sp. FACHB-83]
MSKAIQNILTQIAEDTADDYALNQIIHKLESDFQIKSNVRILEEIKRNFFCIENLIKEKVKTKKVKKNSEYSEFYENLYNILHNIIILLGEVLNNEHSLFQELLRLQNSCKWKYYLCEVGYLIEGADKYLNHETKEIRDFQKFFTNHLKAVKIFLKAIEECYIYLEEKEIYRFFRPILSLLQVFENLEQEIEAQYKPLVKKIIVTTKAILWDINRIKDTKFSESKPTVANLQKYLESSSGWQGDDFEECLELINEMRRN